jgi:hypothetical protein
VYAAYIAREETGKDAGERNGRRRVQGAINGDVTREKSGRGKEENGRHSSSITHGETDAVARASVGSWRGSQGTWTRRLPGGCAQATGRGAERARVWRWSRGVSSWRGRGTGAGRAWPCGCNAGRERGEKAEWGPRKREEGGRRKKPGDGLLSVREKKGWERREVGWGPHGSEM